MKPSKAQSNRPSRRAEVQLYVKPNTCWGRIRWNNGLCPASGFYGHKKKLHALEFQEFEKQLAGFFALVKKAKEFAAKLAAEYLIIKDYCQASYVWRKRKILMVQATEKVAQRKSKSPAKRKTKANLSKKGAVKKQKTPPKMTHAESEEIAILSYASACSEQSASQYQQNLDAEQKPQSDGNLKESIPSAVQVNIDADLLVNGLPRKGNHTFSADGSIESKLNALQHLARFAHPGNPNAVQNLQDYLVDNPKIRSHYGDVARLVRRSWADAINSKNRIQAESIFLNIEETQKEIEADSTLCRIEKLLLSQILDFKIQLSCYSLRIAAALDSADEKIQVELRNHQDLAQKQLCRSIDCLANFRQARPS